MQSISVPMWCPWLVLALPLASAIRLPALATRREVLRSTAAAGALGLSPFAALADEPFSQAGTKMGMNYGSRPQGLGSRGISAFEELKLDAALSDLSEPAAAADAQLKPLLNDYLAAMRLVRSSQLAAVDAAKLEQAASALAKLTSGVSGFEEPVAIVEKKGAELLAARSRDDEGKAAVAAIALGDALTDVAYQWAAADRPAVPKTAIGAPASRPD